MFVKNLLTLLFVLFSTTLLVSCQSMSNQDAGVITGGIAGGLLGSTVGGGSGKLVAVAAGTLAGAYIGGNVGHSMDQQDRKRMGRALESNPVGEPAYWRNSETGARYEVKPTRNVTVGRNRYCREYQTTAIINGKKQNMYGTACRQPDGSWKMMK